MYDSPFPIVRLEVQGMKHAIQTALMDHQQQLNRDIAAAVDAYCEPENLAAVVQGEVHRVLESVIKEEVQKFFRYGEGRKVVADAVKAKILANETFTPLDDDQ